MTDIELPHADQSFPHTQQNMAAPASQYKDRQFLAVIGDEVRIPTCQLQLR